MQLTVDRDALMTEVAAAERVADPRGTPPILSHLLLDAKGGVLAITGCDLKRTLRSECPAEVKVAGRAAVSAQKFLSYLKALPKGEIAVKLLDNQHLQVHAGSSRTRMPGRNPADFPAIPGPAADVIRLSSRALKTVLRQTVFVVATTEERYLLNAALLLLRVNRMGMVATDGHRMSLVEMADEEALVQGNTTSKTLLPRECMLDLLSLLGCSKEETVEFSQDERTSTSESARAVSARASSTGSFRTTKLSFRATIPTSPWCARWSCWIPCSVCCSLRTRNRAGSSFISKTTL
jgi:DNA polymerase-3 subunit beta